MAVAAVVETLDDVPESLHEHYEKDGDGFRLRVDGYDDAGLKKTLDETKAKYRKLRAKMDDVPDDFDKAELEELRKLRQNVDDDRAKAAGNWDELKATQEARHKKEREALEGENETLRGQLKNVLKTDQSRVALEDAGARVSAMLPHVLQRVEIVTEDGTRKAVATGLDGEPTDIAGLVKQMQDKPEDWDWGFSSNGATGGGSAGRGGAGRAGSIRTKADLGDANKNAQAHVDYISEHGQEAYAALPRA